MNGQVEPTFKLMRACLPPLKGGTYKVEVDQTMSSPGTDTFADSLTFQVGCRHFSLSPSEVYSVFPAANASGNFENTLPHVVMFKKTLPWELETAAVNAGTGEAARPPWLAVICLAGDEDYETGELTAAELVKTTSVNPRVFFPLTAIPESATDEAGDSCRYIDLPLALFGAVAPREEELALLAHVKIIDMHDKVDEVIDLDGYLSVVMANRFTPSGATDFRKSTVHLVSMEGFTTHLPGGKNFPQEKDFDTVRLVSLFSWDVFSRRSDKPGFGDIMKNISSGPLAVEVPGDAPDLFRHGHVPKKHITRTGEATVSLYRGPLIPFPDPADQTLPETHTADGRIMYDPENGLFDMSYAAAWQIGRLLTLENKSAATDVFRWRRGLDARERRNATRALLSGKSSEFTGGGDVVRFLTGQLCRELVEADLIAPLALDNRRNA